MATKPAKKHTRNITLTRATEHLVLCLDLSLYYSMYFSILVELPFPGHKFDESDEMRNTPYPLLKVKSNFTNTKPIQLKSILKFNSSIQYFVLWVA